MPLKVRCACGQVLKVPETRVGSRVRCPVCEQRVLIPAAESLARSTSATPKDHQKEVVAAGSSVKSTAPTPASEIREASSDEKTNSPTKNSAKDAGGSSDAVKSKGGARSRRRKSKGATKKPGARTSAGPEPGDSTRSDDRRAASVREAKQPAPKPSLEKQVVEKPSPLPPEGLNSTEAKELAARPTPAPSPSQERPLPSPRPQSSESPPRRPPPLRKPSVTTESADAPGRKPPSLHQETPVAKTAETRDDDIEDETNAEPVAKRTPPALPKDEEREETEKDTPPLSVATKPEPATYAHTSAVPAKRESVEEKEAAAEEKDVTRQPLPGTAQGKESDDAPAPKKQGVIHPASKRSAVYWLAAAVLGMAVAGFSLAAADAVLDAQQLRPAGIANWAMLLIVIGLIHAGYALYLFLFPDWSTVWVVSIVMLVTATAYAMMLAVLALGGGNTPLATAVQLNEFPDQRPELVCLIMLSLSGLLSYLLGRASMRWRRSDQLLTTSTASELAR